MNSIWNKNIKAFMARFPLLAENYGFSASAPQMLEDIPRQFKAPLEIIDSRLKNGEGFFPTAKEDGKFLHSSYNPVREGQQAAQAIYQSGTESENFGTVFFGCGLGYTLLSYAENYKNDTIILVENNPAYFFTALSLVDWTPFFSSKNAILALNMGIDAVVSIIQQCGGFRRFRISENSSHTWHSKDYFSALQSLIDRNKRKNQLNNSTLEKFSSLWLRNSCRNLHFLSELEGVNIYRNRLSPDVPALILAAGPTLQEILPHLKELKKSTLIIAVDTALRACLKAGVEPDFIILADPQYYAYRHIAGLSSPSSVLITESAVYPAVYRFNCRKIVMCSSMFSLGQFVEEKTEKKGSLSAGGSVSTTAWDFARFTGAKTIVFSGLDLGYPGLETHIKGSTFEEKIHTVSGRLKPAEKLGTASLFGANMEKASDYAGREILTDNRMKMFAWWFESKQEEFRNEGIKTYTLSDRSLKIPGFQVMNLTDLLSLPQKTDRRNEFFKACEREHSDSEKKAARDNFQTVMTQIQQGLEELYFTARKGLNTAQDGISDQKNRAKEFIERLQVIDSQIMNSRFKEIASLVFPTENQLNRIFSTASFSSDPVKASFQRSKIIYRQLMESVRNYQKNLFTD